MTVLYPNVARFSTLVPIQSDPEWTFTDRVLSDQPPGAAGMGAVLTAQQALNLNLSDAANLVASQGNSHVSGPALVKAVTAANAASFGGSSFAGGAAGLAGMLSQMQGAFAGRIPIPPGVAISVALLAGDSSRVSLLIQNNNASGNANLLVSIDGAIDTGSPWAYMNLAPGQGIFMDQNAWINPIYVAWASGTVVGGVLFYGAMASKPVPLSSSSGGGIAAPGGGWGGGYNTTGSF